MVSIKTFSALLQILSFVCCFKLLPAAECARAREARSSNSSLRADSIDSLKRSEAPHFSSGNQLSLQAGYSNWRQARDCSLQ